MSQVPTIYLTASIFSISTWIIPVSNSTPTTRLASRISTKLAHGDSSWQFDEVHSKRGASSFRHSEPVRHPNENRYKVLILACKQCLRIDILTLSLALRELLKLVKF